MKSEIFQKARDKLNSLLKNREILDIIIFGSVLKGKVLPKDIDAAIISAKHIDTGMKGFHFSFIKPEEFFVNPPSLAATLLREGYSLRHKKAFAETLRFNPKALLIYQLKGLKNSEKVRVVNSLRGKKKEGLVKEFHGEWLANNVFLVPINAVYIFEKFFVANNIKFKMHYILMH